MNILFVSSEIIPYASTGGLGDVASALPKALHDLGHTVIKVMPLYRSVMEGHFDVKDTGIRLDFAVGYRTMQAAVWKDQESPQTCFIRRDEYFDRAHLYGTSEGAYMDNCDRFVFFQKAVVALIDTLDVTVDVVHCNDWPTGLIPLYLEHGVRGFRRADGEKTVFTIHNLAYQGIFPGSEFATTGLPHACFSMNGLEFYQQMSFMKGGLTAADIITTVSRTYAREIQTPDGDCGLEDVLKSRRRDLIGIVNGVDYGLWEPSRDPFLHTPYSLDRIDGKKACKRDLVARAGLHMDTEVPLIGMVTRLADQKGLDILARAMPEMMKIDLGFILLGAGEEKYHRLCRSWMKQWPERFHFKCSYDEGWAHKIEGGADLYMMPSKFEPCGLNQLYSLRYGTVPIVYATGGLEDTIEAIHSDGVEGTGFKFTKYEPESLLRCIRQALRLHADRKLWRKIMKRAMKQDFSWTKPAREYCEVYEKLIKSKEDSS